MEQEQRPQIIRLAETLSTNNYLRELLREKRLPEGSVVITDFQTGGRGQTGNSWEAEPGKNLLFSIVLYPDFIPAGEQFIISQLTALAVKETLDLYTDGISIKWPNDIYWKDRKICGMLIENDLTGQTMYSSVIGIGINLNQSVFTDNATNPVSLSQITGLQYNREEVLNCFLRLFYDYYLKLLQKQGEHIRSNYFSSLYRKDGYYLYQDTHGVFKARIYRIEPTGHLILQLADAELRRYAFKEVSYLL
jgi:BirA family biotin operon repressor/biotin-[acetyl-CoA-carboxylase] ligase